MAIKIMWFRKDLRLTDNTALNQALASLSSTDKLLCVFHLDEQQFRAGHHSHDYFFSALAHFIDTAKEHQLYVHLLTGKMTNAFTYVFDLYPQCTDIYFNVDQRGYGEKRDMFMTDFFEENHIHVHKYHDSHLHHADEIKKSDGTDYQKFTPYYNRWIQLEKPSYPSEVAVAREFSSINQQDAFIEGATLLSTLIKNRSTDYSSIVGEAYADRQLNQFVQKRLADYYEQRDYPAIKGTSRLSPFLASGQISIRKVWAAGQSMPASEGKETFLKELAWRDFYHMIYAAHPEQKQYALIKKYRQLSWHQSPIDLEKWQNGQTGYPIVDAAMRQLNQTGWMHNRLRMIVASFLTKDLFMDWRQGEAYFAKQLIDYDAASNIGGWQWAASTGTDAVPYFRIFNPTTQGKKFDHDGAFIRTYVHELRNLPNKYIHTPSLMSEEEQKKFHVILDKDYPSPMVDHDSARKKTIDYYAAQTSSE